MSGCAGWEAVNPLCRAGQVLGGAAKHATSDAFGSIADYFAGAASSVTSWLWQQLNTATSINLTTAGVRTDLVATGAIATLIALTLFLVQVIASVLRQDPGGLARAVRGLLIAFVGAAFAIATTQIVLAAVDGLCDAVVHYALGTDLSGLGSKLIAAETLSSIGNPAGLLLISLVLIAAVVVVWVALMIRKMLIIVSAVFAPIAFSGATADASRSWVRRWIEFTVALVFAKLVLVIIFLIGLSVLNGATQTGTTNTSGAAGTGGGFTSTVTSLAVGVLTLLLAGFAPWIAIKMVHFTGDAFHTLHAQAAGSTSGARAVIAAPQKVAATAGRLHPATAGGAVGAGGGGAAGVRGPKGPGGGSGGGPGTGGGQPKSTPSAPAAAAGDQRTAGVGVSSPAMAHTNTSTSTGAGADHERWRRPPGRDPVAGPVAAPSRGASS